MTKEELNRLLREADMSKKEFAEMLGINPRSVLNWGNERQQIPYWVKPLLNHYIKRKQYFNEILKQSERIKVLLQIIIDLIKLCSKNGIDSKEVLQAYNFQEIIQELKNQPFSFTNSEKVLNNKELLHPFTRAKEIIEQKAPHLHDEDKKALVEEIASQLTKEHQEAEHYKRLTQELEKLKKEFEEIKKKIEGNG